MNELKQQILIAELMGWTSVEVQPGVWVSYLDGERQGIGGSKEGCYHCAPNYHEDLNAVASAVSKLLANDPCKQELFGEVLDRIISTANGWEHHYADYTLPYLTLNATPRQIVEALLSVVCDHE